MWKSGASGPRSSTSGFQKPEVGGFCRRAHGKRTHARTRATDIMDHNLRIPAGFAHSLWESVAVSRTTVPRGSLPFFGCLAMRNGGKS